MKKQTGPCRGNFLKWFYNEDTNKCETFTFGGCKGNGNNFLSENECMQRCIRGKSKGLWLRINVNRFM